MSSPDASETLARRGRVRVSVARWAPRLQTSNRHRVYVARSAAGARGRGRPPRRGQRREGGRGGDAEGTDPGAGGPWELKGLLRRVSEKSGHMIARSGPREVTGNRSPGTPGTNAQMKTGEKVTCHLWRSRARSRAMTSTPSSPHPARAQDGKARQQSEGVDQRGYGGRRRRQGRRQKKKKKNVGGSLEIGTQKRQRSPRNVDAEAAGGRPGKNEPAPSLSPGQARGRQPQVSSKRRPGGTQAGRDSVKVTLSSRCSQVPPAAP